MAGQVHAVHAVPRKRASHALHKEDMLLYFILAKIALNMAHTPQLRRTAHAINTALRPSMQLHAMICFQLWVPNMQPLMYNPEVAVVHGPAHATQFHDAQPPRLVLE